MTKNPRQVAFIALREVYRHKVFADAALDKFLHQSSLNLLDKRLATEIVYGCVRRQRTLDAIIDQLATKNSTQQPLDIRIILHIGLYQLRYLNQIPPSAAVDTTVELTKQNSLAGLAGFVNGLLRQYLRISSEAEVLKLPQNLTQRLGILHSYPDWIIENWQQQLGAGETEELCKWFNQTPTIDLRVNVLRTSIEKVEEMLTEGGINVSRISNTPQGLRIKGGAGAIENLPGFKEGFWTVQESSAQWVSYLLDPQPQETIIDACAAPGGKTTHIAELMADTGQIYACDKVASRLKKVGENAQRLGLKSIEIKSGDSNSFPEFKEVAHRVLLDAPCSGLGTLHRRVDVRWRQSPENIANLSQQQSNLLTNSAQWVKPGGVLVYATCTVHPLENEIVIEKFLKTHQNWQIEKPVNFAGNDLISKEGWLKVWPHRHQMDGFFMVRLRKET